MKSDEQKLNLAFFKPSQKSVESFKNERMGALRALAASEGSCVATRARRPETFDKAKVGVM